MVFWQVTMTDDDYDDMVSTQSVAAFCPTSNLFLGRSAARACMHLIVCETSCIRCPVYLDTCRLSVGRALYISSVCLSVQCLSLCSLKQPFEEDVLACATALVRVCLTISMMLSERNVCMHASLKDACLDECVHIITYTCSTFYGQILVSVTEHVLKPAPCMHKRTRACMQIQTPVYHSGLFDLGKAWKRKLRFGLGTGVSTSLHRVLCALHHAAISLHFET